MQTSVKDSNTRGEACPLPASPLAAAMILFSALLGAGACRGRQRLVEPGLAISQGPYDPIARRGGGRSFDDGAADSVARGKFLQYFPDLQPNGADLRFVADNGTPLNYQLELLDPAAGCSFALG